MPVDSRQAVIICTRNRPADVRRTLGSVAEQQSRPQVMVVDASDGGPAETNRSHVAHFFSKKARHFIYPGAPSLTRQRNFGLDHLPTSVKVVHFVDDDVTVQPGYFHRLAETLRQQPALGGVGGAIIEPARTGRSQRSRRSRRSRRRERLRQLFLLSGTVPGQVLPSGVAVPAQQHVPGPDATHSSERRVQWLSGCASTYRRAVFAEVRFDPVLSGYALHEDLDFSYRVGRSGWELAVVPQAQLLHHTSAQNRYDAARSARAKMIHRRWFVEKNLRHPLRHAAFWWSAAGRLAALLASADARKWAALRGLGQGARAVLRRDHPLLRPPLPDEGSS